MLLFAAFFPDAAHEIEEVRVRSRLFEQVRRAADDLCLLRGQSQRDVNAVQPLLYCQDTLWRAEFHSQPIDVVGQSPRESRRVQAWLIVLQPPVRTDDVRDVRFAEKA